MFKYMGTCLILEELAYSISMFRIKSIIRRGSFNQRIGSQSLTELEGLIHVGQHLPTPIPFNLARLSEALYG